MIVTGEIEIQKVKEKVVIAKVTKKHEEIAIEYVNLLRSAEEYNKRPRLRSRYINSN